MEKIKGEIMRGTITDIPFILVIVMGLVLAGVVGAIVLQGVHDAWPVSGQSKTILDTGVNAMYVLDYMIPFVAVGLSIFSIGSSLFIRSHPIFFIFSVVLLLVVIFVSAVMTNVMDAFLTAPAIVAMANNFPITVTFVRNFPLFCLVIGLVISLALYAKSEESSGGGY